jgi:hypothetical protein
MMKHWKKILVAGVIVAVAAGFGAWWTMFRVDDPEAIARDQAIEQQLDAFDEQFGEAADDDDDFADLEAELAGEDEK